MRDVAAVSPVRPLTPCRGACRNAECGAHLARRPLYAQRCDVPPVRTNFVVPGFAAVARRTPGISCEAVPACCRGGAGIRRHLRPSAACGAKVGAAESFVSFIPLFGGPVAPSPAVRSGLRSARRAVPEAQQLRAWELRAAMPVLVTRPPPHAAPRS